MATVLSPEFFFGTHNCSITVRSTTFVGALVMGFKKTKYVSNESLQFESILYENALCQISALEVSGLTHSDSFFVFLLFYYRKQ